VYPRRLLERQAQQAKAQGMSILIPVSLPKSGGPLLQLAEMLAGPDRAGLYALHLRRPDNHEAFHPESVDGEDPALTPLLAQARARNLVVEPITLMSQNVPEDIAAVSAARDVDLVLMGFHNPVFGKALLGGTVHKVLASCPAHVAVFVDRGFRSAARILVPFLGGSHDRFALELANRIAQNTSAQVTILHVIAPLSGAARNAAAGQFPNPLPPNLRLQVVEDTSPAGVVLHQAQLYDLVVIGVSEEWGLESHLFGWRPERIARDCPASLLIVRHFTPPTAATASHPAVPAAQLSS
jgi:nucleotide-binding universal stress UspA family protein